MTDTDIVFIVDGFAPDGSLLTAFDRIKAISDNWQENLFTKHKAIYQESMGDRVKFIPYSEIKEFDPTIKYFYFMPMNDWHCTAQIMFNILDKDMQRVFAENSVSFYFCQDLEMYPNLNINFFANYLGWLHLCKQVHSYTEISVYFAMCSKIVPHYLSAMRDAFGDMIHFVNSPVEILYAKEELKKKFPDIRNIANNIRSEYMTTPKQKMYMSLTRDSKYHRMTMLHGLRIANLLDDGFVSNLLPHTYARDHIQSRSMYAQSVSRDIVNSGCMPLMQVDEASWAYDTTIYPGINAGDIPTQFMSASCYDLIQETATNYEGNMPIDMAVVTEKTVKSIIYGRPFMINGGQGSLDVLRGWGFKTYPMLFDERYDICQDFIDRQEIIVSNVARWKGKYSEFMNRVAQNDVQDIISHNTERMLAFPIEELLIKEISLS
jgi:hypothetical protein